MIKKIQTWALANRKLILVTFELFWIFIFLLDRVTSVNSVEIPQFIYVNF